MKKKIKKFFGLFKKVYLLLISFVSYEKYAKKLGVNIGKKCQLLGRPSFGSEPYLVTLGDHVMLAGAGTQFITHEGAHWVLKGKDPEKYRHTFGYGRITVGNNVYIGTRCTILRGVTIGDNVIVGACTVVNKDLPSGGVYAGVPAKRICSVEEWEEKFMAQMPTDFDLHNYLTNKKDEVLKMTAKK
ncbi:MAG: acyltransferase [Clostridia bacterium]|nr:acyltransferase [Clostridia bacterium]